MKLKIQLVQILPDNGPAYFNGTIELSPELLKILSCLPRMVEQNDAAMRRINAALDAKAAQTPPAPATAEGLTDKQIQKTYMDLVEQWYKEFNHDYQMDLDRVFRAARESIAAKAEVSNLKDAVTRTCGKYMRDHIFDEAAKAGRVS